MTSEDGSLRGAQRRGLWSEWYATYATYASARSRREGRETLLKSVAYVAYWRTGVQIAGQKYRNRSKSVLTHPQHPQPPSGTITAVRERSRTAPQHPSPKAAKWVVTEHVITPKFHV